MAVETVNAIQAQRMPDTRRALFLILAAMQAYYESIKQPAPVQDSELMYNATPDEIGNAIGTILALRMEFYHIPKDEPEEKNNEEDNKKNA